MNNIMKCFGMGLLLFAATSFTSCSEDDLDANSIFSNETTERNDFDNWLLKNYVDEYNISFQYRYYDKETTQAYNVIPANQVNSKAMAILVQHLFLDVYNEYFDYDKTFMKTYSPRVIQLLGCYQYSQTGSLVLGSAEQGLKIMLFGINDIDINEPYVNTTDFYRKHSAKPTDLNYWYFHTFHHEFCHILTQTKEYSTEYRVISSGAYHATDWVNVTDQKAATEGFVTGYASGEYNEDFAETYACYVTMSEEAWQQMLKQAGENGAPIIKKKLQLVREYFKDCWNIDIDKLRDIIVRRSGEVPSLDLETLPTLN